MAISINQKAARNPRVLDVRAPILGQAVLAETRSFAFELSGVGRRR